MARHADSIIPPFSAQPAPPPRRGAGRTLGAFAVAIVGIMVVALSLPFVFPDVLAGARSNLPWFPPPPCDQTTVYEVVTVPLVQPAVSSLVSGLQGKRLSDDSCLSVKVRAQDPQDTLESSEVLPPARAPQLWISDSSLWPARVTKWKQRPVGSFGSTPVVFVSAGTAVVAARTPKAQGGKELWATAAPRWQDVFGRAQPLWVPGAGSSAAAQLSLVALWQTTGKGSQADKLVALAGLAARATPHPTADDALSALATNSSAQGDRDAAFIATTEQAMVAINATSNRNVLTPVYPAEGSPSLDFPVLRLAEERQSALQREAGDLVLGSLSSPAAREKARNLGLRDPKGGDRPTSTRGLPETVKAISTLSVTDLNRFLLTLGRLFKPSKMLVAMDVSTSMSAEVPGSGGLTRADVATRAAIGVGKNVLSSESSIALWTFAVKLDGTKPYKVVNDYASLGTPENGSTHLDAVVGEMARLPQQLRPGGTGLYFTTIDAIRAAHASYDPRAGNAVVLFTDGQNQGENTYSLGEVTRLLKAETDKYPTQNVRLFAIGLGGDVDKGALDAMASATGGTAYQVNNPGELSAALLDAMSRRGG